MIQTEGMHWTDEAKNELEKVPAGSMRDLTLRRVEEFARKKGYSLITPDVVKEKYENWAQKSKAAEASSAWSEEAKAKIMNIPEFVRSSVIRAIERHASEKEEEVITLETLEEVKEKWGITMKFHAE